MVTFIRAAVVLLLLASAVLFVMYASTGQQRYKYYGLLVLKWTVFSALGFFAVIIAQNLLE